MWRGAEYLEKRWGAIRDEFYSNGILHAAVRARKWRTVRYAWSRKLSGGNGVPCAQEEQHEAIATQNWFVAPVYHQGEICRCAGDGCPVTCSAHKTLVSEFGLPVTGIMFSIVGPKAHLRPHCVSRDLD
eukprot:SAG11_NODE_109_length_16381_cov_48.316546_7_plen_129_part_00